MADYIIRSPKVWDISRINAIEKECFPTPWTFDALFTDIYLNPRTAYFTAVAKNEVVGYGGMWLVSGEAHITNVAVTAEYRSLGIATAIMNALIERAREEAQSIWLEVRESNDVAQALYRKMGFHVEGNRPKYYSNPVEDALIMVRQL